MSATTTEMDSIIYLKKIKKKKRRREKWNWNREREMEVKDNQRGWALKSSQLLISVSGGGGVERKTTAIGALPDRYLPSSMTPISLTDQSVCKQFSSPAP